MWGFHKNMGHNQGQIGKLRSVCYFELRRKESSGLDVRGEEDSSHRDRETDVW